MFKIMVWDVSVPGSINFTDFVTEQEALDAVDIINSERGYSKAIALFYVDKD